jgi:hypothetical protein
MYSVLWWKCTWKEQRIWKNSQCGRKIWKWIFKKQDGNLWTGFIGNRFQVSGGLLWTRNEHSGCTQCGVILFWRSITFSKWTLLHRCSYVQKSWQFAIVVVFSFPVFEKNELFYMSSSFLYMTYFIHFSTSKIFSVNTSVFTFILSFLVHKKSSIFWRRITKRYNEINIIAKK